MKRLQLFGMCDENDSLLMQERWSARFPEWITFIPVKTPLPGRRGLGDTASDTRGVPDGVFSYVADRVNPQGPYVFFGYRAGCLLALELACRLVLSGKPGPSHLFLSGANAPHVTSSGFGRRGTGWTPLPCRLSILSGRQDTEVMLERLSEWSRYVQMRCDIRLLDGGGSVWIDRPEELIQSCVSILEREYAHRA